MMIWVPHTCQHETKVVEDPYYGKRSIRPNRGCETETEAL